MSIITEIIPVITEEQNWEFQYACRSASASYYFTDSTDEDNITLASVEVTNSNGISRWINYKLFGASPSHVDVGERELTYYSCFPHVDVKYEVDGNKLKETIIVNERNDMLQYTFSIKSEGCTSEIVDNEIIFTDVDTGEELWRIEKPNIVDCGNNFTDASHYEFSTLEYRGVEYDAITLVIDDAEYMDNAMYPLFIDPTTITSGNTYGHIQFVRNGTICIAVHQLSSGILRVNKSTDGGASWSILCSIKYDSYDQIIYHTPLIDGDSLYVLSTRNGSLMVHKINHVTQTNVTLTGSTQYKGLTTIQTGWFPTVGRPHMAMDSAGTLWIAYEISSGGLNYNVSTLYLPNARSIAPASFGTLTSNNLTLQRSVLHPSSSRLTSFGLHTLPSGQVVVSYVSMYEVSAPSLHLHNLSTNTAISTYSLSDLYTNNWTRVVFAQPIWEGTNVTFIIHRYQDTTVHAKKLSGSGTTLASTHTNLLPGASLSWGFSNVLAARIAGGRVFLAYSKDAGSTPAFYRVLNANGSTSAEFSLAEGASYSRGYVALADGIEKGYFGYIVYNSAAAQQTLVFHTVKFAATIRTRVSGSWKESESVHVRVGGAWKEVESVSVRVGGSWKEAE